MFWKEWREMRICWCLLILGAVAAAGIDEAAAQNQPSAAQPAASGTPGTSGAPGEASAPDRFGDVSFSEARSRAMTLLDDLTWELDGDRRAEMLDDASLLVRRANRLEPNNPWMRYLQGRMAAAIGRGPEARGALQEFVATREGQNEWTAYRTLGDLLVDGFPTLARQHYERAAALHTGEASVLFGLSRCLQRMGPGFLEDAIQKAEAATLADRKNRIQITSHLASLYSQAGRYADADKVGRRAWLRAQELMEEHESSPQYVSILNRNLALLLNNVQRQIAETPDDANLYLKALEYYRAQQEVSNRLELLRQFELLVRGITETNPQTPTELLIEFGKTQEALGREAEALGTYRQILQGEPNNQAAKQAVERLSPSTEGDGDPAP
jgi:tetratricopeptide (TPR) repeat protein